MIQLVGKRFKCGDIAPDNRPGAFETVVIPTPPVTDLEALAPTLDAVPSVALATVGVLGHIHLGASAK